MSTPAASPDATSTSNASSDTATILRLQKLERAIAKQIKDAEDEATKNPLDPSAKLLVSQLTAQLTAIQGEITVPPGTASPNAGRSSLDDTKLDTHAIDTRSIYGQIAPQDPRGVTAAAETDKTRERRKRPFRFDLTGSQVDDEA